MPSAASAHPLWGAVLRSLHEMTRLAVAVLALSAGFGAAGSVASAADVTASGSSAVVAPVSAPAAPRHAATAVGLVTVAQPASTGTATAPAAGDVVPLPLAAEQHAEPTAGLVAPVGPGTAPGTPATGPATRRGPPSA